MKVWLGILAGSMAVLFVCGLIWLLMLAGCEHRKLENDKPVSVEMTP